MKSKLALAAFTLLAVSFAARAFTLIPISATLNPKGFGAATSFRVENESSNRIAFQITMITRDMDETGNEKHEPATNLFTVFPPQGVIAAGQRQNVRVVWKGPADITNELAFRIVAEELPVNFEAESKESHIKLLLRYMGTVYIKPRNAKPHLQTVSLVKAAANSAATNAYELTLTNAGNAHQGLKNCQLTISGEKTPSTVLKAEKLEAVEGQNILAHHTRRFSVTLPAACKEPEYHAQLQVDE